MTNHDEKLEWLGPFVFIPRPDSECIFDCEAAKKPGIYIWAIEHQSNYFISYVGKCYEGKNKNRNMSLRIRESVTNSLGGRDGLVFDPNLFSLGHRQIIARPSFTEFLKDYARYSAAIYRSYDCLRAFVAPCKAAPENLKYIDSGILRVLLSAGDKARDFLSNDHNLNKLPPSPTPFQIRMIAPVKFHGLETLVVC